MHFAFDHSVATMLVWHSRALGCGCSLPWLCAANRQLLLYLAFICLNQRQIAFAAGN